MVSDLSPTLGRIRYLVREGKPVPHVWENGPVNITPNAAGQYGLCSSGKRLRPV